MSMAAAAPAAAAASERIAFRATIFQLHDLPNEPLIEAWLIEPCHWRGQRISFPLTKLTSAASKLLASFRVVDLFEDGLMVRGYAKPDRKVLDKIELEQIQLLSARLASWDPATSRATARPPALGFKEIHFRPSRNVYRTTLAVGDYIIIETCIDELYNVLRSCDGSNTPELRVTKATFSEKRQHGVVETISETSGRVFTQEGNRVEILPEQLHLWDGRQYYTDADQLKDSPLLNVLKLREYVQLERESDGTLRVFFEPREDGSRLLREVPGQSLLITAATSAGTSADCSKLLSESLLSRDLPTGCRCSPEEQRPLWPTSCSYGGPRTETTQRHYQLEYSRGVDDALDLRAEVSCAHTLDCYTRYAPYPRFTPCPVGYYHPAEHSFCHMRVSSEGYSVDCGRLHCS